MPHDLPTVRIAVADDEPEVMAMCGRLHRENGLFTLNEEKVRNQIRKCFARQGTIVGVIGDHGKLQASTCLSISDYYYSDDWHLAELWNFVDKDYRKSRNAEALIEFGKSCADKMGCPLLTGIITNSHMAGKVRLYRRLLGHPAGAFFIYNSKWKSEPIEDHSDLRQRLRELAVLCNTSPKKINSYFVNKKIGPLLREAADAIGAEDNVWSGVASALNGAAERTMTGQP